MRDKLLVGLLALGLTLMCHSAVSGPQTPPAYAACNASISTLDVSRGDENFSHFAAQLNSYFSGAQTVGPVGHRTSRPVVSPNAESIRIEIEATSCDDKGRSGPVTPKAVGGCDYVGCTGDLDAEFDTLPAGSTVNVTTCGGGIQQSGTFIRQTNGTWMMTAYRQEMVTSCSPMG